MSRRISLIIIIIMAITGCADAADSRNGCWETLTMESLVLGKEMTLQVYLPENYGGGIKYPVLYFLPSNGGSSFTVTNQFGIAETADELIRSNEINPMIIVAVGIDNSFGINSGSKTKEIRRALTEEVSEVRINEGMYEDYIVSEVIPYIDGHYSTDASRNGRYIGGYSMGGFAALHVAFRHSDLFAKVGGHSPSLIEEVADTEEANWQNWLYPNQETRSERDPLILAETNDLDGLSVFLDTGDSDVNVGGCQKLYETLMEKKISVEFNLFPGTHGFAYCRSYMDRYLLFYGGTCSAE